MYLIDKNGVRPVCVACKKAAKKYGIQVPAGRAYICDRCKAEAARACASLNVRRRKTV